MSAPTINQAAVAAREDARQHGKFGPQGHLESGLIILGVPAPADFEAEEILSQVDDYMQDDAHLDTCKGYRDVWANNDSFAADGFRADVSMIAEAMSQLGDGRFELRVEYLTDSEGARKPNSMISVRDTMSLFTTIDFVTDRSLTTDTRATGRNAARSIAKALIRHRDRLGCQLDAQLDAIKASIVAEEA